MTGQLFVVPADAPGGSVRPPRPRAGRRPRAALPRHPEVREDRAVRPRPVTGELVAEVGGGAVFSARRAGTARRRLHRSGVPRRRRRRKGRLKSLLIDQAFVAGVGNIYADEALWRARLHPLRTAARSARRRAAPVRGRSARVLGEAVERRGSSIDDYTAPDGDGSMQERLDVYQRTGEPCRRCGRPVKRIVIGARSTHFCSWCQRLPARDRAGAGDPQDDDRRRRPRPSLDGARRRRGSRRTRGEQRGPLAADRADEAPRQHGAPPRGPRRGG